MLRIKSTLRYLGWGNGLTYLFAQVLLRLSGGRIRIVKYHLVVQPIGNGIGVPEHRGRGVEILEAKSGDPLLELMEHRPETIAARFQQGGHCLVALRRGELAGFLWWVEGPYREDEVRCLFVPEPQGRSVWDFDVYICPRDRFSPVFSCLWDAASRRLFALGYRYTCSRISAFNPASLAAHRSLGGHVMDTRLFVCLGPLEVMFGRQHPRMHVSMKDPSRPRVDVGPRAAVRLSGKRRA